MSQQGFVLFRGVWGLVKLSLPKYYLTHLCWETYTLQVASTDRFGCILTEQEDHREAL